MAPTREQAFEEVKFGIDRYAKYFTDVATFPILPPGITDGVPAVSTGKLAFDAGPRSVIAVLNNAPIATRTWPVKDNHLVIAEFLN